MSRRWQAQVGRKGIGDAPICFVPAITAIVIRSGTARPKALSDWTKWSGGLADGCVQSSVSELLQFALCSSVQNFSCEEILSMTAQGVPGSHRGLPGEIGLGGTPAAIRVSRWPWTAPTTFAVPGAGKGLNSSFIYLFVRQQSLMFLQTGRTESLEVRIRNRSRDTRPRRKTKTQEERQAAVC